METCTRSCSASGKGCSNWRPHPISRSARYPDGMEKPPFQFGLKAIFVAMTVAAAVGCTVYRLSSFAEALVALTWLGMVILTFLAIVANVCICVWCFCPRPNDGKK